MINLSEVIDDLSEVLERRAAEKIAHVMFSVYERLHESLVLQRLEALESRLQRYSEEIRSALEGLAQRIEEQLAASRAETDVRFRELAEAQRRTEERLAMVIEEQRQMRLEMRDIRRQLGGLSQTVGYVLENEAMKHLPDLLLRDHGLHVQGRLKRQYVSDKNGQPIEVNIFGTARRDSDEVAIVGESKAQLSKNDIDRFLQRTVDALRSVYPQIFPLLVTHMISEPDVEDYARNMGVALYYSYEF